jgi:uncharacterized membrane protein YdcZ (DUF606 family)
VQNSTLTGIGIALGSGLAIGIQSMLFTLIGRVIGPVRASLILNVTGGILAGVILLGVLVLQGRAQWNIPRNTLVLAVIAVAIGIAIIIGVAASFQRMGIAAGFATVFLGQMLVGVVIDMLGGSGGQPIPLDLRRVAGLIVLVLAIMLLVRET